MKRAEEKKRTGPPDNGGGCGNDTEGIRTREKENNRGNAVPEII